MDAVRPDPNRLLPEHSHQSGHRHPCLLADASERQVPSKSCVAEARGSPNVHCIRHRGAGRGDRLVWLCHRTTPIHLENPPDWNFDRRGLGDLALYFTFASTPFNGMDRRVVFGNDFIKGHHGLDIRAVR